MIRRTVTVNILFKHQSRLTPCLLLGAMLATAPENGMAQSAPQKSAEDSLYQQYQVSNLNLTPLAQLDAWLGYLRMHPQTPHRDSIRWRLRYLAATLSPRDEERLLAMLAYQQLPDLLVGLESRALQQQAAADYIQRHPALLELDAQARSYVRLLDRLGVEDTVTFIARAQGKMPAMVASKPTAESQSTSATRAGDSVGAASAAPTGMETGSAPAAAVTAAATPENTTATPPQQVAAVPSSGGDTSSVASSGASSAAASGASSAASSGASSGEGATALSSSAASGTSAEETAVAMRAPREERLTDSEKESLRYPRWKAATAPLSPEARLQLWSTYLLLYPESTHLTEISEALQTAQKELEMRQRDLVAQQQKLQEQQNLNRELQTRVESLENGAQFRRTFWAAAGGSLLLMLLLGLVSSI